MVGGGLMLVGLAIGVTAFVLLFRGIMTTDASLPVDGARHRVSVPTDGDRMIWADTASSGRSARSRPGARRGDRPGADQRRLRAQRPDGDPRFDPGSGDLEITCEGDTGTAVDIGPSPSTAGLVGGILVAVLAPLLLGGLGFVVVLVTGVLWSTRPPRPKRL